MRKLTVVLLAIALLAAAVFAFLPPFVEALLNRAQWRPPYPAPDWARALAADEVDLHADPLLWGRDLLERGSRGHVDLPRLLEAGALLQVFGVVTQAPLGMNVTRNRNDAADMITGLAVVSRWPRQTWKSRRERALYLAQRLRETAARSAGKLVLVRSRADLDALLAQRRAGSHAVGALLGLEGSQALEGDLESISALFAAGFRMMAPTHFVDTEISGSAHGEEKGGLTPLGRRWLATVEEKRILVDLAHASPQTLRDVLAAARRPVVVSHTGVKATCDSPRNLSDDQLRALAKNGGLVGIGYWKAATCGTDAAAIARAMRHAADAMGVEHVALGSDFDGAVKQPFDVTGLPLLAEALRVERFSDAEVRAIFTGNAVAFLSKSLP
jgi:microsomal dipeptidase-like Zn-dependent dipeptidase